MSGSTALHEVDRPARRNGVVVGNRLVATRARTVYGGLDYTEHKPLQSCAQQNSATRAAEVFGVWRGGFLVAQTPPDEAEDSAGEETSSDARRSRKRQVQGPRNVTNGTFFS
jgi:hypothetical protein